MKKAILEHVFEETKNGERIITTLHRKNIVNASLSCNEAFLLVQLVLIILRYCG
jgi:hypothetical protein